MAVCQLLRCMWEALDMVAFTMDNGYGGGTMQL
jgi:hypothetical protein